MNLDERLAANKAKLEKHQDWKWWKDEAYKAATRAEAAETRVAELEKTLEGYRTRTWGPEAIARAEAKS